MSVANQLTILRLLLAPVLVMCIVYQRFGWALFVLFVAGVSDALDGRIARMRNENSSLGALLDPLADKILIVSSVIALAVPQQGLDVRIPAWVAILVIARDATILTVALAYNLAVARREFPPSRLGKATTATYVLGILWILFCNHFGLQHPVTPILVGAMVAFTIITSLQYLWRARLL